MTNPFLELTVTDDEPSRFICLLDRSPSPSEYASIRDDCLYEAMAEVRREFASTSHAKTSEDLEQNIAKLKRTIARLGSMKASRRKELERECAELESNRRRIYEEVEQMESKIRRGKFRLATLEHQCFNVINASEGEKIRQFQKLLKLHHQWREFLDCAVLRERINALQNQYSEDWSI